ncbi:MAG TPA: 5'-methylthioadenosine/S-adenosylhomocysteine nucleosidase [Bacillota bacterium]|nr:5'-methylthioadenosine/S-adenosylhomocysteine nucleosidase [Bacillota bacterium]
MKIGIIGAMDEEIQYLLEEMTHKKEREVAGSLFVEGKIHAKDVVLLKSGIGKVNAAIATTILHERYSPDAVINTGSAGGLDETCNVGDVVIASYVIHHDVDVTAFNYDFGQVPGMPTRFLADEQLNKIIEKIVINHDTVAHIGAIATGDSFMNNKDQVAKVMKHFPSTTAVEMEAASIAQVCHRYETPFVMIRALSDIAGKHSSISFDQFLDTAAKNASSMIVNFIAEL